MDQIDILALLAVLAPPLFGIVGYLLGVSEGAVIHGDVLRGEPTKGLVSRFARWVVWGRNNQRRF